MELAEKLRVFLADSRGDAPRLSALAHRRLLPVRPRADGQLPPSAVRTDFDGQTEPIPLVRSAGRLQTVEPGRHVSDSVRRRRNEFIHRPFQILSMIASKVLILCSPIDKSLAFAGLSEVGGTCQCANHVELAADGLSIE